MKIGFFTDDYFPRKEGATYTIKTWKEKMEERGHEVHVIYPSSSIEPSETDHPALSVRNPFFLDHRIPLFPCLDVPELDVCHSHSPYILGVQGLVHGKLRGLPTVYTFHTPLEFWIDQIGLPRPFKKALEGVYLRIENYLMKKFGAVTSNSEKVQRDVDAIHMPVGIDTDFFKKSNFEPDFDFERPVIGRSGRVGEEKNIDELIEFAEEFDGTVVVAGEGLAREELERQAPGNVVFHDFFARERLPGFLSWLDAFITCSRHDTLNLTHLEASACGTPVVAPNLIPFNNTVNSRNGRLYEPGDIDDLKKKVAEVLEGEFDPRERAEEYSVKETMKRLEEIYGDLGAG